MPSVALALSEALGGASVVIANRRGRILGVAPAPPLGFGPIASEFQWVEDGQLPDHLAAGILKVGTLSWETEARRLTGLDHCAVAPVVGAGRRVGTLVVARLDSPLTDEDLAVIEAAALACGLAIAAVLAGEEEVQLKERQVARTAVRSLSYSELEAVRRLLAELPGDEGMVVASRIADQAGITRSVAVNALRKLASANVIEARSLGMKGTYLRILNPQLRAELSRQRHPAFSPESAGPPP
ncbi:GAF domain-containing protein [Carboxydochorda subterranea]|uniref:Global transcriptional regulator CodY n=1 Tax=Carboxydichorda subterranea TaxID=3109565 RepID=A0ABZ1BVY4_9FIRM|nr:GAF domain-containing protein [Limnochorda sp. L945t]WRP16946.1 GAF domain-containing protein [Limnochorda sp. L945t]